MNCFSTFKYKLISMVMLITEDQDLIYSHKIYLVIDTIQFKFYWNFDWQFFLIPVLLLSPENEEFNGREPVRFP